MLHEVNCVASHEQEGSHLFQCIGYHESTDDFLICTYEVYEDNCLQLTTCMCGRWC
jgi:hypothetical protein